MSDARLERHGAVAHLVIDNPATRNGLTADMSDLLVAHLQAAVADDAIRCIVVRGAGEHFCSGADLTAAASLMMGAPDDAAVEHHIHRMHAVVSGLASCPKPTIAVIRGACVGIGLSFAMACDLRVAAVESKFGLVFTRIGLHPDGGSSYLLPRLVGLARAMELALLAETFNGEVAAEMGLVNRALPAAELDAFAMRWIEHLAAGPPIAYRLLKSNIHQGAAGGSLQETLDREANTQVRCLKSGDVMRGVQAFFSKSTPVFEGT